jgi:hypothetical protein
MTTLVAYESMYGNTRLIAEAIGRGLAAELGDPAVSVRHITDVDTARLARVDLLVVGGPTHAWSMSRPSTRKGAAERAAKPNSGLTVERTGSGDGIREWVAGLPATAALPPNIAAFDTRMHAPLGLSGAASKALARRLRRSGVRCAAQPMGFYVTKKNVLEPGESARAEAWGKQLARLVTGVSDSPGR